MYVLGLNKIYRLLVTFVPIKFFVNANIRYTWFPSIRFYTYEKKIRMNFMSSATHATQEQ